MEDGRAIRLWTATGLVINAEVCILIEFERIKKWAVRVDSGTGNKRDKLD